MQHEFDKLPTHVREILTHSTTTTEWKFLTETCIRDKEAQLARLDTNCDSEKFHRKYLAMRSQISQLEAFHDLLNHIEQLRNKGTDDEI